MFFVVFDFEAAYIRYVFCPFISGLLFPIVCSMLIISSLCRGVCAGSHSVGRLRNRWIDTVKDCLRKRGLDARQARKMVQD